MDQAAELRRIASESESDSASDLDSTIEQCADPRIRLSRRFRRFLAQRATEAGPGGQATSSSERGAMAGRGAFQGLDRVSTGQARRLMESAARREEFVGNGRNDKTDSTGPGRNADNQ